MQFRRHCDRLHQGCGAGVVGSWRFLDGVAFPNNTTSRSWILYFGALIVHHCHSEWSTMLWVVYLLTCVWQQNKDSAHGDVVTNFTPWSQV